MQRILLSFFVFAFLLSGCVTRPDGPQSAVNLPAQLASLTTIKTWKVTGRLAMRSGNEALSASLSWKTDHSDFTFRLTNLLGVTLVDLSVNDTLSTLEAGNDTYTDTDPSALIYRATQWRLPVTQLTTWIKGLPTQSDTYTLNDKGLIETLQPGCQQCSGWTVSYDHFGQVDGVWLPYSLTLRHSDTPTDFIKIRIDKWTTQ